jgi:hypothetical protein
LDRIENLETDNPKEYWSLVNQLRNEHSDKPESSIDGETWYKYFSELTSIIIKPFSVSFFLLFSSFSMTIYMLYQKHHEYNW